VDEEKIRSYMDGLDVRKVLVLDDSKIKHHGKTIGNIGRTNCPVLGWKNMYYGKFVASKCVLENEPENSITMQTRFDILSHYFSPTKEDIFSFVKRDYNFFEEEDFIEKERVRFINMRCCLGVDNIYMATTEDMHRFISYMYYDMDRILEFHKGTIHQEHIVFHERKSFYEWQMPSEPVDGPAFA
jgi:hypothetical protein